MPSPDWRDVSPEEWDAFDHVCVLGIEHFQPMELRVSGHGIPRHDAKRSNIRFPFLNDRTPRLHQIVWVTKYFSTLFADGGRQKTSAPGALVPRAQQGGSECSAGGSDGIESFVGRRKPFLLCDDAGLGKTTEALMIVAYFRWLLEEQPGPQQVPLLSNSLLRGKFNLDISHMEKRFLVQSLVSRKPILMVTLHATKEQLREEIDAVLQNDSFEPYSYSDLRHPARRKSLDRRIIEYRDRKSESCPIVIMSWHDLLAENNRNDHSAHDDDDDDFVIDDDDESRDDDDEFFVDDDESSDDEETDDGNEDEETDDESENHNSVCGIEGSEDEGDSDHMTSTEDDDSDASNDIDDIEILSNVGAESHPSASDDDEGDFDVVRVKIYEMEWSFLVLDEIQEAREPASVRFQHVRRLPRNADHTLGMTATPFWNRPVDLLNLLRACGLDTSEPLGVDIPRPVKPLAVVAAGKIKERYGDCHGDYHELLHFSHALEYERQTIQRAVKALPTTHKTAAKAPTDAWDVLFPNGSSAAAKPLQKKWAVYIEWLRWVTVVLLATAGWRVMRRLRVDHLQLKPEVEETKSIKLSTALQKAYDKLCDDQRKARQSKRRASRREAGHESDNGDDDEWVRGTDKGTFRASLPAGFDTLKRMLLVDPARVKRKYGRIPSPKVAIAIKICKTIMDKDRQMPVKRQRKIAIFCEWSEPEVIARVTRKFKSAGVPVAVLNGRIPDDERAEIIEKFQRDGDHRSVCGRRSRVILFSQASSAGVNLHRASVLITLDNVWTFARREQI